MIEIGGTEKRPNRNEDRTGIEIHRCRTAARFCLYAPFGGHFVDKRHGQRFHAAVPLFSADSHTRYVPHPFRPPQRTDKCQGGVLHRDRCMAALLLRGHFPLPALWREFNFVNARFESVSGFTTTGSTILTDVESLPNGLLFWRSGDALDRRYRRRHVRTRHPAFCSARRR